MLLRHIRYFLAVAEQGNFTRAAEALHVSQPTLSQQIKQLEDTLGAPLFDRSGRAVRLTDAGEAWMRYARLALQDLDAGARAIHDVATLERGPFAAGDDADLHRLSGGADDRCVLPPLPGDYPEY